MANHFEAYKTHLARPSETNQFSFPHSGLLTLSGRTCVASRPPSFFFFWGPFRCLNAPFESGGGGAGEGRGDRRKTHCCRSGIVGGGEEEEEEERILLGRRRRRTLGLRGKREGDLDQTMLERSQQRENEKNRPHSKEKENRWTPIPSEWANFEPNMLMRSYSHCSLAAPLRSSQYNNCSTQDRATQGPEFYFPHSARCTIASATEKEERKCHFRPPLPLQYGRKCTFRGILPHCRQIEN